MLKTAVHDQFIADGNGRFNYSVLTPYMSQLKMLRYNPRWILSNEQLLEIQQSPQHVLSKTAHHLMENGQHKVQEGELKPRNNMEQLLQHIIDFMTDVLVHDITVLSSIVATQAYTMTIARRYPDDEYRLDNEDAIRQVQHHVRYDLASRGYLIRMLPDCILAHSMDSYHAGRCRRSVQLIVEQC